MTVIIAAGIALFAGMALLVWLVKGPTLVVNNDRPTIEAGTGPLSGLLCSDSARRPIAIMLASDPEARPLSGIRAADLVIEAPVTPNGITRFMAVFQCREPSEVGSIRSARATFIPLAQGLQAIYAHWGGERDVLARLDAGIIDNVDALAYEGTVYYRKSSIPRPHNGFTTLELVREQADKLGYVATASLAPYRHVSDIPSRNLGSIADTILVPGPPEMEVEFQYDTATMMYQRWRGGNPEIDREDGLQVAPAVVILMEAEVEQTYDQYLDLRTIGEGDAVIYQQGRSVTARWQKLSAEASLRFTDADGQAVPFAPGQIWIIIQSIQ